MRARARLVAAVLTALATFAGLLVAVAPAASAQASTPIVTGMSTHHGSRFGEPGIAIHGSHFSPTSKVTFGGTRAPGVRLLSQRTLEVTSPARLGAGPVHVYVYNSAGHSPGTGASAFRYDPAPSIRAMSRHVGREDGTPRVRIYGHDFIDVQSIAVGTERSTGFTVRSSRVIDAYLPPYSAGVRHVRVITASGASDPNASAGVYQYISPPEITAMSSASGSVEGGTPVVIRGTDFADLSSVQFGSAPATDVVRIDSGEIRATTPAHAEGVVHAIVTTRFGSTQRTDTNRFRFGPSPAVTLRSTDDADTVGDPAGQLADVSCATNQFCIAVDHHDRWIRTDDGGTSWSAPRLAAGGWGISCPSVVFCMSVIQHYATPFDGTSFTLPFPSVSSDGLYLLDVACPTETFCLALDANGKTTTWNGTSWSTPARPSGEPVVGISCWAPEQCAAVSSDNFVTALRDGTWQPPVYVRTALDTQRERDTFAAVDCPDADHCFIGTEQGTVLTYGPAGVSTALAVLPIVERVDCADATSCIAVGPDAETGSSLVSIWDGSHWSAAVAAPFAVARASCPSAGHCVLVGGTSATTLDW